jgi:riboflavin synthase
MFTGIVECTAEVKEKTDTGLTISRPDTFSHLKVGQSLSVNGTCLSVAEYNDASISFDVIPETFARTNLRQVTTVNVERSLSVNGRFEGHIVLGHVDGTAEYIGNSEKRAGDIFCFAFPESFQKYFVEKGSVSVNGVSLTIASVQECIFEVALIPHTLQNTNFGILQMGDSVNIEIDYFAKLLHSWHKI